MISRDPEQRGAGRGQKRAPRNCRGDGTAASVPLMHAASHNLPSAAFPLPPRANRARLRATTTMPTPQWAWRSAALAAVLLSVSALAATRSAAAAKITAGMKQPDREALSAPSTTRAALPVVVVTWASAGFETAADVAFEVLADGRSSPLDAAVAGCAHCERDRCDGTVGYGGSPDERGETTLDAMAMDGVRMRVGAVGQLRRVRSAAAAARLVMERTAHTMLVGESATEFAVAMSLEETDLTTPASAEQHARWVDGNCQPNFWVPEGITPDPTTSCGPYSPSELRGHVGSAAGGGGVDSRSSSSSSDRAGANASLSVHSMRQPRWAGPGDHDTIAVVAVGANGHVASATSTNGAANKVHGRVGDSPVAGAGSYARFPDGGCGATGNGDVMVRFLPCYQAVESMSRGMRPRDAAVDAIARITKHYPDFGGAIVVVNTEGEHSAACSPGLGATWSYSYRSGTMDRHAIATVECK